MSLTRLAQHGMAQQEPEVYISESAMSDLVATIIQENATQHELLEILEEGAFVDVLMERSIVRLDKQAKKDRAYELAKLQLAKEDNSRDWKKLVTLWKMEKLIKNKFDKIYGARALRIAAKAAQKAKSTNSPKAKIVANRIQVPKTK